MVAVFLFCGSVVAAPSAPVMAAEIRPGAKVVGSKAPTVVARVPFELVNRKILLPVRINGSAVYDFVLDTGSPVMLLSAPELAPAMRLASGGRLTLKGAGRGESPEAFEAAGATVSLEATEGRVDLTEQRVLILAENPQFGAYLGVRSYGIIGRGLFARYVVEIDFDRQQLVLYEPASYAYRGPGEVVPIRLQGGHPHCDAIVELASGVRRTIDVVIDSGAGSALTLIENPEHGLVAPAGTEVRRLGRGLNGEIHGAFTRLPRLQLGDLEIRDVVTAFAERRSGIAPGAQANLGADVLRRFRVIFDYPQRQMILEPGETFGRPFDIDMSGMLLRAEGPTLDQLIIEQVREGSPAALVGVEPGDRLLALDGREVTLEQAAQLLRQRDGFRVPLTLDRAGETLEKQITLKRDV
ncbi:MAG: PDZ domain-containing protein [Acidobacteriota bacterium]